ncbi:MAG TPA: glycosyl transferase family 36 [Candidatus Omnitrophota bacterium]|jgi:cellobiose phosphorylase|nr:MAG: N,N'-diacetylchitobiose phosphorylase [Candidatus Omnitrophica bacterium ADurb.Bin314]HQB94761.1 glycosyl transferase family 36 [Candidatus Omnitrophota bacterium]
MSKTGTKKIKTKMKAKTSATTGKKFASKYGYFTPDGREYVITRPDTPRPWVNVISNGDYGTIETQTGSGFSWRDNSNLSRITRWDQDLIRDNWGKYIYLRDKDSGKYWSGTWKPCMPKYDFFEVRHGQGYTVTTTGLNGIRFEKTIFVDVEDPVEVWKVVLTNETAKKRRLSLFTYFDWCLGNAGDTHREFHKTFIEVWSDRKNGCLHGLKRAPLVPGFISTGMTEKPLQGFHSSFPKPVAFDGDKESFLGRYGEQSAPSAVVEGKCRNSEGKWGDASASLQVDVDLAPKQSQTVIFTLGSTKTRDEAVRIIKKYQDPKNADRELARVRALWDSFVHATEVETPDEAMNFMTNTWLKYQAISARLWGKCAYYQSSGGYGFRDQLQDCQIFFATRPELAKKQILLHAEQQFPDGTVYHWWHHGTNIGAITQCSDDLLWLDFITLNYLDETDDRAILDIDVNFLPDPKDPAKRVTSGSLYDHLLRAIDKALTRFSPRGLPLIGECDWNDGLSHVGIKWKGESIWLGHFLYGILNRIAPIMKERGDKTKAKKYLHRAEALKEALNKDGWDGEWYLGATRDDGRPLGSRSCETGKIFLNCQTWAVITGVSDKERSRVAMNSAAKWLYKKYGPLLLTPGYNKTDPTIGYITRYAPSVRENGGLYTHAGTWAIQAEAMMRDGEKAYQVYKSFNPILRGLDPDLYFAEPYVTPGNVDGPDSPNNGRGGWTWYTGSGAWYAVVALNWLLGIRPTAKGLIVDPVIPKRWPGYRMKRLFRGTTYMIEVKNGGKGQGVKELIVDGKKQPGTLIPDFRDGQSHRVEVTLG